MSYGEEFFGESETYTPPRHGWTCFHCGETFLTVKSAREHFGLDPTFFEPACVERLTNSDSDLIKRTRKAEREASEARARVLILGEDLNASDHWKAVYLPKMGGAKHLSEAFMNYDAMEGRALAAEEKLREAGL